jgi:hypothetical protein
LALCGRQPSLTDNEYEICLIAVDREGVPLPVANLVLHVVDRLAILGVKAGLEYVPVFGLNIHVLRRLEYGGNVRLFGLGVCNVNGQ